MTVDTSDAALLALADRLDTKVAPRSGIMIDAVEAAAALRAIVAERQAGPKVKPLVWLGGLGSFCANTPFTDAMDEWSIYVVEQIEGSSKWGMWPPGCDADPVSIHLTEQDGFAAAQFDYAARIRAALKGPNDE
jgi:hypothetical protein